ncbi:unnamed protein product [Mytilus coruscus]|uniref:Uncharacterized protein n=1 Tax=Mytilus coruscus TaxID=42192 RepID=A0A6J8CYV4_MYTCO|nr:unnamed protein product [Mytilus coruscus]
MTYYLHISANELRNCKHESVITCNFNKALIPTHVQQCTFGFFNNDINQVSQFCDFRFLKNRLTHDIIELSSTSVLVYQSNSLALHCPGKQTTLPGCKFCVIHLPCKCSLSTVSLYLPPRLVNCYNKTSELSVFHSINLAVLQEFFNENKLRSILGGSLFSNQISMTIPDFTFYSHYMSIISAADHEVHLSLTNRLTMKTVQIPDSVSIGYFTRRKLNKILMQSFNAYVLVTHPRFATVLNPASFGT